MDIRLFRDRVIGIFAPSTSKERPQTADGDLHKGAVEDEQPTVRTNAPGLDDNGLPNDQTAIAQDAIGARADGSQG